jgi:mRNA (guanine-N7-)-methyltransferase
MDDFVKLELSDLLKCINGKDADGNDFRTTTPPHNKVKDEFNKFVKKEITQRRNLSTIAGMRKFHNYIKRTLIVNVASKFKNPNLIDIAVGRGGDISKWEEAGIKNVFGFDYNTESIHSVNPFNQGANERYRLSKKKVKAEFEVGDATDPSQELLNKLNLFTKKNKVQIVSCQFALHYFFKNDYSLNNVLKLVSSHLQRGGYFIGTTTDSTKIKEYIKSGKQNVLFDIKSNKGSYTFKINDAQDEGNYFNTIPESIEYYTDFKKLTSLASEYNLVPDNTNFFEKNGNAFTHLNFPGEPIKNTLLFEDIPNDLSPDEKELNSLYTVFVFKKV